MFYNYQNNSRGSLIKHPNDTMKTILQTDYNSRFKYICFQNIVKFIKL